MVAASNWPPFTSVELPPSLVGELGCILEPLYVATLELHRTVYRYELLAALGRNWDFVQRINGTTAAPALNTVKGCVSTSIVLSLCALFDEEAGAVSLKKILNEVLRPEYADRFREFHATLDASFNVSHHLARLGRMQRRLRRGTIGKAIERLRDLRNQMVAHLDTKPEFGKGYR